MLVPTLDATSPGEVWVAPVPPVTPAGPVPPEVRCACADRRSWPRLRSPGGTSPSRLRPARAARESARRGSAPPGNPDSFRAVHGTRAARPRDRPHSGAPSPDHSARSCRPDFVPPSPRESANGCSPYLVLLYQPMSCPYFDPVAPRGSLADPRVSMLPLGAAWTGICRADPLDPAQPDEADLRRLCNLGYARRSCRRFPPDSGSDAVRFALKGDDNGSIRLAWVVERDHHPFANGTLEYSRESRAFVAETAETMLLRQARAYIESYLRLKQAAARE